MNYKLLMGAFFLAQAAGLSAKLNDFGYSVGSALNAGYGTTAHFVRTFLRMQPNERLSPQAEALARSVLTDMGVRQRTELYKTNAGHHCIGNHIYINENDSFSNDDEFRFVTGHEATHADKFHCLKEHATLCLSAYAAYWLLGKLHQIPSVKPKLIAIEEKLKKIEEKIPHILRYPLRAVIGLGAGYLLRKVVLLAMSPLIRSHEKEADLNAIEKLSKVHGADTIKRAGVTYLAGYDADPQLMADASLWRRMTGTHPSIKERVTYIRNYTSPAA